jgi:hypothetical protein
MKPQKQIPGKSAEEIVREHLVNLLRGRVSEALEAFVASVVGSSVAWA